MPVPGGIEVRGQRGAVEVIGRDPVRALVEDATGAGSGVGLLGQPPAVTVTETSFQGTPVGMTLADITKGLTNNDIGSSPASATANGLDNLPSEFDAAQDNFVDLVADDETVAAGFSPPHGGLKPSATYPAQVRVAWNNFVTGTSRFGQLVYQLQEQAPAMPILSMMFAASAVAAAGLAGLAGLSLIAGETSGVVTPEMELEAIGRSTTGRELIETVDRITGNRTNLTDAGQIVHARNILVAAMELAARKNWQFERDYLGVQLARLDVLIDRLDAPIRSKVLETLVGWQRPPIPQGTDTEFITYLIQGGTTPEELEAAVYVALARRALDDALYFMLSGFIPKARQDTLIDDLNMAIFIYEMAGRVAANRNFDDLASRFWRSKETTRLFLAKLIESAEQKKAEGQPGPAVPKDVRSDLTAAKGALETNSPPDVEHATALIHRAWMDIPADSPLRKLLPTALLNFLDAFLTDPRQAGARPKDTKTGDLLAQLLAAATPKHTWSQLLIDIVRLRDSRPENDATSLRGMVDLLIELSTMTGPQQIPPTRRLVLPEARPQDKVLSVQGEAQFYLFKARAFAENRDWQAVANTMEKARVTFTMIAQRRTAEAELAEQYAWLATLIALAARTLAGNQVISEILASDSEPF